MLSPEGISIKIAHPSCARRPCNHAESRLRAPSGGESFGCTTVHRFCEPAVDITASLLQMMGWVETGSCRRYSQSAGDSALASLPQPEPAGGRGAAAAPSAAAPGSDAHLNFLCAKALKVASQYARCPDPQQVCARRSALLSDPRLEAPSFLQAPSGLQAVRAVLERQQTYTALTAGA